MFVGDTLSAHQDVEVPVHVSYCLHISITLSPGPLCTFDRASTSSALRTSNLSACPYACFCRVATSFALSLLVASDGFQPFGSSSKARRSQLFPRLASLHLRSGPLLLRTSTRFLALPLSMIPEDSDAPLRCPITFRTPSSGCRAMPRSPAVDPSHGLGEARWDSMRGADTGVGKVVAEAASVVADRENVRSGVDALGVNRARLMGETSIRADRDEFNGGVLSDLTVPSGALDCNNGAGALVAGMTSGARRFGDMALAELATGVNASSMTLAKKSSSSSSSVAENGMAVMARSGLIASSGALMERSWRAGLPGIVAVHSVVSNIIVKINSAGSCRT